MSILNYLSENILDESKLDDMDKIEIYCRDRENSLVKILSAIAGKGNVGHSFEIIIDPDNQPIKIGWDGDGSDYIKKIIKNGKVER